MAGYHRNIPFREYINKTPRLIQQSNSLAALIMIFHFQCGIILSMTLVVMVNFYTNVY